MRRRLLDAKRAAQYLGVSVTTLNLWCRDGKQPAVPDRVEIRGRRFFVVEDLDRFIEQHMALRSSTT
jgi:predicted site-specific integrase-resolvase